MWRWDQAEPFGNSPADENPSGLGAFDLPLRLPGQRYDKETGLAYNMARDYASDTGRYVQSDPIGLEGGTNTYAYVGSRPIDRIDPLGLVEWDGSVAGGTFLTGGVFTFGLKTKCIDGKQGVATVVLVGAGFGFGATKFSFSASDVKLQDSLDHIDPMILNDPSLNGGFIASVGLSLGEHRAREKRIGRLISGKDPNVPTGGGCAAIRLGNAGGAGCGTSRGLEFGGGILWGSSTVVSSSIDSCQCVSKQ